MNTLDDTMLETELLHKLEISPENIQFKEVIQVIDDHYAFTPVTFTVGKQINQAGENQGSCKVFAFAKLHDIAAKLTPQLFGEYYRNDVLKHPNGEDHQNIRNFLQYGWEGVRFDGLALTAKP